jgi:hypothetical protein
MSLLLLKLCFFIAVSSIIGVVMIVDGVIFDDLKYCSNVRSNWACFGSGFDDIRMTFVGEIALVKSIYTRIC